MSNVRQTVSQDFTAAAQAEPALPSEPVTPPASRAGRAVRRQASGLKAGLSTAVLCSLLSSSLAAQESTTTTTVVTSGRSYLIDGAIVVVLCGLAVFAVCRASRRS